MACRVVLVGGDARNAHYRTDFHRVNLQRKVAGVPPLTPDDFALRAEAAREEAAACAGRRAPRFCAICSKKFSSERALANHVASRRHRDAVRARAPHMTPVAAAIGPITEPPLRGAVLSPADSDAEPEEGEEEEDSALDEEMDMERRIAEAVPFAPTDCVFDGLCSKSAEENLAHMRRYGFFLPFAESLADLAGLLEYLGQKVGVGYACVECDRAFASVSAAQRHMVDKQHCRMTSDEDVWFEEYAPFYAFEDAHGAGTDGWEEVEGAEAAAAEAAMKVSTVGESDGVVAVKPARRHEEAQEEEVEMVLGGKVIGHRSLQRYYRQRLRAPDTRDAVVINRLASDLRVLGWQGKKMPDATLRNKRMSAFKFAKSNLAVGMKNYYTRKAPLRVSFSALNSGYVRLTRPLHRHRLSADRLADRALTGFVCFLRTVRRGRSALGCAASGRVGVRPVRTTLSLAAPSCEGRAGLRHEAGAWARTALYDRLERNFKGREVRSRGWRHRQPVCCRPEQKVGRVVRALRRTQGRDSVQPAVSRRLVPRHRVVVQCHVEGARQRMLAPLHGHALRHLHSRRRRIEEQRRYRRERCADRHTVLCKGAAGQRHVVLRQAGRVDRNC